MNEAAAGTVDVSAVICTRNRDDKIGTAVASVLANRYPAFDLTVIDQSTNDATRRVVEPIAATDQRLRYFHVEEVGLSRAYNNGIGRTTGEVLAFTDDDCIAPADWLDSIVRAFDAEPDGDLLYGQVLPAGETDEEREGVPTLTFRAAQRLSERDGFKVFGMGANFAARRRLFALAGPFDEVLGGGGALWSSQDYDLAYRTFRAGRVILLRPEVTVRHDGRREAEDWPALLLAYGSGDGAFYMKHVRCRDGYALWLFVRQLAGASGRSIVRMVRRRGAGADYPRGMLRGAKGSFRFGVDRRTRLYVER